jgi:uncharacterized protein
MTCGEPERLRQEKDQGSVGSKQKGVAMAKRKVKAAIEFFERCLREGGVTHAKIILFGSQAKGKATKESDIDVVIISEDFRNKDILERAAMTKDAEIRTLRKFMIPLDIVTLTPEENKTSLIATYAKGADVVTVK